MADGNVAQSSVRDNYEVGNRGHVKQAGIILNVIAELAASIERLRELEVCDGN